ncbi:MAG: chemotaxis protein CheW [Polyangiaceae bacterium]|nr:chemotaxis protein CheW [Polyangiaceae bacterium]
MPTQFCTFYVGDLLFGIDVKMVQEVMRYQEMTRVPLSSPMIRGLINLRGQLVTAVDMRRRLGLPPLSTDRLPMNVIIRREEDAVSVLVDEIGDVIDVGAEAFERPPETLMGAARELIRSVCKLEGALLLVLDAQQITAFDAVNAA